MSPTSVTFEERMRLLMRRSEAIPGRGEPHLSTCQAVSTRGKHVALAQASPRTRRRLKL